MSARMILETPIPEPSPLRAQLRADTRVDEAVAVARILSQAQLAPEQLDRIAAAARRLVEAVRAKRGGQGGLDAFLHEYALSTQEGIVLMCLAEALLRIPDADTVDRLIRDKIGHADWERHLGASESLFVNASTWALMLTGRLIGSDETSKPPAAGPPGGYGGIARRILARGGEPLIRQAVTTAMRILGRQFVMGRTIEEALERARPAEAEGYRHSYDMLGEAARTAADADRYDRSYHDAIQAIGKAARGRGPIEAPGISVKLSALHPRYEFAQAARVRDELVPRVVRLCEAAQAHGIGLTLDAEEADRLDLSMDVLEAVSAAPALAGWEGLGLAVQAYQKRAPALIDWLADLAGRHRRRLMVRLVKGAYWDSEIKRAQERGLAGYPVYTRKVATDVSYIACARRLLAAPAAFYPQFATHNAHTLAVILELAGNRRDFEFQRLHGMGEALYAEVVGADKLDRPCRVYAPVGSHEDLLAYLVRRLLENGANTSFVNRLVDARAPIDEIVADPVARLAGLASKPHPRIALPRALYGPERPNAQGIDLADPAGVAALARAMDAAAARPARAVPLVGLLDAPGTARPVRDPSDHDRVVGEVVEADGETVRAAVTRALVAGHDWDRLGADARAGVLARAADLYEAEMPGLMALAVREGGRTVPDALSEVREAIDFLRYYADRARRDLAPVRLPGPTGEQNELRMHGRGVFACISPWNFPIAIFTGQIAAALAAGNAVVAKPAEQTPLVGAAGVALLHRAGVPADALALLPGDGAVGAALVGDPRVGGVAFTGSTETARAINRALAGRDGPIVPFIAETGGQNAMIVDSSALPEQVVNDVLLSAFNSAGQRCSALRVLFVQDDLAPRLLTMLQGAMEELRIGDPALLSTDVGPVIDQAARQTLEEHAQRMRREHKTLVELALPPGTERGTFFAPRAYEIDRLDRLEREVFGPILHVIRWKSDRLDQVIEAVRATGYALTLGIHSRIDETVRHVVERLGVGNTYVNRNMVGAVVGVQPFGGEGLSGTGPKAGGPHYLFRFASERTVSIDTTAAGGNASLLSLDETER